MPQEIVLYDLDSKLPGRAWSPNVWKTRYCLNYKGIPHRTEWMEWPDTQVVLPRIGAQPTEQRPDGSWKYTVPVIYDPNTGKTIAYSIKIAEYLDAHYPNSPKLFPDGTKALQAAYLTAYRAALPAVWQFAFPPTEKILNPASIVPYHRTKSEEEGASQALSESERRIQWARIKNDFAVVDGWLAKKDGSSPFILGDSRSFNDFVFAGYIRWLRLVWGEDSEEWKDMSAWHNGRWGKLLEELETYTTVH